jgi:hypothetical protein
MRNLFLFFCIALCFSCERSLDGDCYPIIYKLSFEAQEGVDSIIHHGYRVWFTELQKNEWECEFIKPERIECSWFSVEITSDSTIIASVKQNNTSKKRFKSLNIKGNDGGTGRCSENSGWFEITQCPPYDSIKPSKDELSFSAEGGVESVVIDNIRFRPYLLLRGSGISEYDPPRIYIEEGSLLAESWFTISVSDEKTIVFSVTKNETGKERTLIAKIVDTDICGSSSNVKIIQSAE